MSPRRRVLFAALATIVLAAVALVTVRALQPGRPVPDQAKPGTVLLVPGYGGSTASLQVLATSLRDEGRTVVVVQPPDNGTGDLDKEADTLDAAADQALRTAPSVDVVGYSAGGVVVRLWVQNHDGVHKARRIVTLGSPHHGASIAAVGVAVGSTAACPVACQQLAPGSQLLNSLHEPVPRPPLWLSVRTASDETVTPLDSPVLQGALNVQIPATCAVSHSQLPSDPGVLTLVKLDLGAAPVTDPQMSC